MLSGREKPKSAKSGRKQFFMWGAAVGIAFRCIDLHSGKKKGIEEIPLVNSSAQAAILSHNKDRGRSMKTKYDETQKRRDLCDFPANDPISPSLPATADYEAFQ